MRLKQLKLTGVVLSLLFVLAQCSDSNRLQDALKTHVEQENRRYPMKIDNLTKIDSCVFIAPTTLQYRYTLTGITSDADTLVLKAELKKSLLEQMEIEPGSQYLRSKDVVFKYRYNNTANQYLFEIDITPEDYRK